mmetsp:Transcript_3833/g.6622  ORF Transcript_3833/g.6622 Transcript_3833/m.6622 type:complete len:273 (+) Transcript_3833:230-1048(+)
MRCRNSSIRRRLLIVSAAIAYVAVTTASTQAAATHAALSTTSLSSPHSSHPNENNIKNHNSDDEYTSMVPTFSCGSHWQSATQCNQLCIDGSDTSCPTGQYCYAGIPCSKSNVEESTLRMEAEWMERLIRKRDGNGVKEFVCGVSFEEAESSCGSNGGGGSSVHYCNSGQSSECPSNMQCFASVACGSGSSSSDDSSYPSSLLSAASSSPSQQQPTIISFSSPTANVTPIILQEEENDDDASSFSYYSFHSIVGTMGSKLWTSLGEFSHSKC